MVVVDDGMPSFLSLTFGADHGVAARN
jgi:hypothetical protein